MFVLDTFEQFFFLFTIWLLHGPLLRGIQQSTDVTRCVLFMFDQNVSKVL